MEASYTHPQCPPLPHASSSSPYSSFASPSQPQRSQLPQHHHHRHQQTLQPLSVPLEEGALRRPNAPSIPPIAPAASSRALSILLSHALAWSKDAVASARKVWMPLAVFVFVACCHVLGWAMLMYSAVAIWGPTTPTAVAAAAAAASKTTSESLPLMAPPQFISGVVSLADFQSLGFVIYMASVGVSFVWLGHFVRTRREELSAREEERWRGMRSPGLQRV